MNHSLDHLPIGKRNELKFVVDTLLEDFRQALAHRTAPRFREGRLLKIILFGSYARGDWVEDPVGRYFSDYDLLVVVSHEDLADPTEFWADTEMRLLSELASGRRLRTPVSLIIHSLDEVNEKLKQGRYFFMDILREGVVLFEEPDHPFVDPQPLAPAEALSQAQEYFDEWFESAAGFADTARYTWSQERLREAAFQFHQATERFYHSFLLVRTLHSPKTHNLSRLRALSEEMDDRLKGAWATETKFERRCFELLREAYVKARYSRHYKITDEQLAWLGERIDRLQALVKVLADERFDALTRAADGKD